jgi:hypothetical protein
VRAAEFTVVELREHLRTRKEAVLERWLKDTLEAYAKDTSAFLKRRKDRFANPVGHALREGTRAILDNLLTGRAAERSRRALDDIIRIRAIQDFSPSLAVAFVLRLKRAIRAELGALTADPNVAAELTKLEEAVDGVALVAFDIYVESRERVYEIRVSEIKRQVAGLWGRLRDDAPEGEQDPDPSAGGAS